MICLTDKTNQNLFKISKHAIYFYFPIVFTRKKHLITCNKLVLYILIKEWFFYSLIFRQYLNFLLFLKVFPEAFNLFIFQVLLFLLHLSFFLHLLFFQVLSFFQPLWALTIFIILNHFILYLFYSINSYFINLTFCNCFDFFVLNFLNSIT